MRTKDRMSMEGKTGKLKPQVELNLISINLTTQKCVLLVVGIKLKKLLDWNLIVCFNR